jgi:hypothetical protein
MISWLPITAHGKQQPGREEANQSAGQRSIGDAVGAARQRDGARSLYECRTDRIGERLWAALPPVVGSDYFRMRRNTDAKHSLPRIGKTWAESLACASGKLYAYARTNV